jgi:hypothetical protein
MFGSDSEEDEETGDDEGGLLDKVSEKAGEAVEDFGGENLVTIHFRDETPPVECMAVWTISHGQLIKAEFAGSADDEYTSNERRVYPMDRIKRIEGDKRGVMPNETRGSDFNSETLEKFVEATR